MILLVVFFLLLFSRTCGDQRGLILYDVIVLKRKLRSVQNGQREFYGDSKREI